MAKFPLKNVIFLMQKHLSSSASATHLSASASASSSSSFTVDYLMKSCGLPLKSAITTSRKLRGFDENNLQRYDSVIHLFKSHGFGDSDVAKVIQKRPDFLNEVNLNPKVEFLVQSGFSDYDLRKLIVSCPEILGLSLSDHIKPSLDFLSSFLGDVTLKLALRRHPRLLLNNLKATLQPNVDLLLKEGVPLDALRIFLTTHPDLAQTNVDSLVSALPIVKHDLNTRPTACNFLLTVLRVAGNGVPLWEKKLQLFNSHGFSQQQTFSIFKQCPQCICLSEKILGDKLSFYFDTAKLKKEDIVSYPELLTYSIEARIRWKHNALKVLMSEKLVSEGTNIAKILTFSALKFNSYVRCYVKDVQSLREIYPKLKKYY